MCTRIHILLQSYWANSKSDAIQTYHFFVKMELLFKVLLKGRLCFLHILKGKNSYLVHVSDTEQKAATVTGEKAPNEDIHRSNRDPGNQQTNIFT